MIGIKYTASALLCLLFILPALTLFPTPQFAKLEPTVFKLSN